MIEVDDKKEKTNTQEQRPTQHSIVVLKIIYFSIIRVVLNGNVFPFMHFLFKCCCKFHLILTYTQDVLLNKKIFLGSMKFCT